MLRRIVNGPLFLSILIIRQIKLPAIILLLLYFSRLQIVQWRSLPDTIMALFPSAKALFPSVEEETCETGKYPRPEI